MNEKSFCFSFIFLLVILDLFFVSTSGTPGNCFGCEFHEHSDSTEHAIAKLSPLCGLRYSVDIGIFRYQFGVCVNASLVNNQGKFLNAGVIQYDQVNKADTFVLGSIKKADIMFGTNWIMLKYDGGDSSPSLCNQTNRQANIVITCDKNEDQGKLTFLEENNMKFDECYYLFELRHKKACPDVETNDNDNDLSSGSIMCICLFSLLAVYLVGGFLFMRFVRKAKGYQQIPNFEFWKELGNLQADGCDFVCRSNQSNRYQARDLHEQDGRSNGSSNLDDGILTM